MKLNTSKTKVVLLAFLIIFIVGILNIILLPNFKNNINPEKNMFYKLFKQQKKVDKPALLPADRFSFMPQEEQLQFQDEITRYFEQHSSQYIIDFSKGAIFESSNTNHMQYGLDTVAQMYHQASFEDKKKVVPNHFNSLFKSIKEEEKILKDINDFSKMKKFLAVRLYPTNYEPNTYEMLVYREDIEGIYTVLVLDLPSTSRNIRPEEVERWGINRNELFKIGLENVFSKSKVEIKELKLIDELYVGLLEGDSIYTTTSVMRIEKYPELIGKYGSLIIIPHRHAVVAYPIENKEVIKMTNHLPVLATNMFNEGPGSITPNLYWYHNDKFTKIDYQLDLQNKSLNLNPPEEFTDMLNSIFENNNGENNKEEKLLKIKGMFRKMKTEAKWDMSKPMLWGYFFLDPDKKKLEALTKKLSREKFDIVNIEATDDKEVYRLHIEEKTIHTPESLIKQNNRLEYLAKENDIESFDGWDVEPIAN